MRAVFNKRIRVRICLESRNPDSGHSARACSSLRITPPGAMNLLLRGQPEIAIYPYNIFLPFRKLPLRLTLHAKKGNQKRVPFWQLSGSAITFHREWRELSFRCDFSVGDRLLMRQRCRINWYQIDTENSRGKSRWINLMDRFRTLSSYFFFSDVRGRFIHSRKLSISNCTFYGRFCKRDERKVLFLFSTIAYYEKKVDTKLEVVCSGFNVSFTISSPCSASTIFTNDSYPTYRACCQI